MYFKYAISQRFIIFALLISLVSQSCDIYKSTKVGAEKKKENDTIVSFIDKSKLDTQKLQSAIASLKNKFTNKSDIEFFDINSGSTWCLVAKVEKKGYYIRIPWDSKHDIENKWSAAGTCGYGSAQTMRDLHVILRTIVDACPGAFQLEFTNGPFGQTTDHIIYTGPESAKEFRDPWGRDWWDEDYGYDDNKDSDDEYNGPTSYSVDASGVAWEDANDMYAYGDIDWGE